MRLKCQPTQRRVYSSLLISFPFVTLSTTKQEDRVEEQAGIQVDS